MRQHPPACFAYFAISTRTVSDQVVRVFLTINEMLTGKSFISFSSVSSGEAIAIAGGACLPRFAAGPGKSALAARYTKLALNLIIVHG